MLAFLNESKPGLSLGPKELARDIQKYDVAKQTCWENQADKSPEGDWLRLKSLIKEKEPRIGLKTS